MKLIADCVFSVLHVGWSLLQELCSSSVLRLGQADLTASCCDKLAEVIVGKPSLQELDVSYSHIGDEGVLKLCEAVKNPNCHLKYLM